MKQEKLPLVGSSKSCQLAVLRQHSLEVDEFVENGQPKSVHYVVKNSAFVLEVALKNDRGSSSFVSSPLTKESDTLDFNKITLETKLLYDCRDEKEVACVKVQPLTYRGVVKKSNPSVCFLEATIKVLSSQHEDMNFRLKFTAVNATTKAPIPEIAPAYSQPIQVISKPEVLKKKNQPRSQPGRKNKTKSELILETLARIEATQAQQQLQIDQLAKKRDKSSKLGKRPLVQVENNKCFTTAFNNLISAYRATPLEERPTKLKKIAYATPDSDLQVWNTIVDQMKVDDWKPSPQTTIPPTTSSPPTTFSTDLFEFNSDEFLSSLGFN